MQVYALSLYTAIRSRSVCVTVLFQNKKCCYRRGNAQRSISVFLSINAHLYKNFHLKRPTVGEANDLKDSKGRRNCRCLIGRISLPISGLYVFTAFPFSTVCKTLPLLHTVCVGDCITGCDDGKSYISTFYSWIYQPPALSDRHVNMSYFVGAIFSKVLKTEMFQQAKMTVEVAQGHCYCCHCRGSIWFYWSSTATMSLSYKTFNTQLVKDVRLLTLSGGWVRSTSIAL